MACRDKEVDRIEPRLERGAGVLKHGASSRINVVATSGASPCAAVCQAVEGAVDTASAADMAWAVANVEDMDEASLIIREPCEELADVEVGG